MSSATRWPRDVVTFRDSKSHDASQVAFRMFRMILKYMPTVLIVNDDQLLLWSTPSGLIAEGGK